MPELVARKLAGSKKGTLQTAEIEFHKNEFSRLLAQLETQGANSQLPDEPSCRDALNDLLVRIRLRTPGV